MMEKLSVKQIEYIVRLINKEGYNNEIRDILRVLFDMKLSALWEINLEGNSPYENRKISQKIFETLGDLVRVE